MKSNLERLFDNAMMKIYHRAWDEAKYKATRFHQMLCEHGGLETAQLLLHSKNVSEGYTALWERKRLDLTVEALILNPEWHELFSDIERNIARNRLKEYEFPITEAVPTHQQEIQEHTIYNIGGNMYDKIAQELKQPFYTQNFPNDGQRFVAWYLHRVLLLDMHETRAAITDGQDDKQIDAIVVEDGEDRRIRIIQGKFIKNSIIDASPLREVLSAWTRLKDIPKLQIECSGKLAERLEAMREAVEDDYDVEFELLTTGELTEAAKTDFDAFKDTMSADNGFGAGLTLVDSNLIETRLLEAEQKDLPELTASLEIDTAKTLITEEGGYKVILSIVPLSQCIKLPGISDQKLFRRNVRQSLGINNKVNKAMRNSIVSPEKRPYFFFFHNGITALCSKATLSEDKKKLTLQNIAVVNGCQSLSTIFSTSGKVASNAENKGGSVLFRFYEIPQFDLGEAISINTNSQSAVKPKDLRSNDKYMKGIKRRYEFAIPDGYFLTKRGEKRPADKDEIKTLDSSEYGKMVVSWMCQRPNLASNEKKLFDELYKTVFHPELEPESILALNLWLREIDKQWEILDINEAVKAVKGSARFHLLFAISQMFSHASNQSDKVVLPFATKPALQYSGLILGQAKGCLNQALQHAHAQSQAAGKIFSPQNWLKGKSSVSDEQLVAGTIVNIVQNMATTEQKPFIDCLRIAADKFSFRWSAD